MSFVQGPAGTNVMCPPFACHRWVESRTQGVVPNRSDGATPIEMTELDNDDVSLLDKSVHPFDCEKVVKIGAWVSTDKGCAYSTHRC